MRVLLVFLVALFTGSQVFARIQKPFVMKGTLGLYTSGQDCGKVLIDGVVRYPAEFVQARVDDAAIPTGFAYKLTVELANERKELLAAFRTDAPDVLPYGGGEAIGEVRASYSPIIASTVRYDTDGKGAGDEVRFASVFDDFPFKVIVSGSRTSRGRDCVIEWIGEFSAREQN